MSSLTRFPKAHSLRLHGVLAGPRGAVASDHGCRTDRPQFPPLRHQRIRGAPQRSAALRPARRTALSGVAREHPSQQGGGRPTAGSAGRHRDSTDARGGSRGGQRLTYDLMGSRAPFIGAPAIHQFSTHWPFSDNPLFASTGVGARLFTVRRPATSGSAVEIRVFRSNGGRTDTARIRLPLRLLPERVGDSVVRPYAEGLCVDVQYRTAAAAEADVCRPGLHLAQGIRDLLLAEFRTLHGPAS